MEETRLKVLTVGDGDFTFSLALKRAYPSIISVTASSLLSSSEDLIHTYSNSHDVLKELQEDWKEMILFGVDATKLDSTLIPALRRAYDKNNAQTGCENIIPKYDFIIFNHPHLGDAALHESEKLHAQRHYTLLCHYFNSARQFLSHAKSARIHVCLCGTQPQTWNILGAAKRNGLLCCNQEKTVSPINKWLFVNNDGQSMDQNEPAEVQSHYKAPRKYRNGKLGSKHFLGKYGYRHRRTGGDLYKGNDMDMMVEQSINFIFKVVDKADQAHALEHDIAHLQCDICGVEFDSKSALLTHIKSPATPDIMNDGISYENLLEKSSNKKPKYDGNKADTIKSVTSNNNENQKGTSATIDGKVNGYDEKKKIAEVTVSSLHDGKRLKWCCRQEDFFISKFVKSKKHCIALIKAGRIFVNKLVAVDSSRILNTGDIVTLVDDTAKMQHTSKEEFNNHGVKIIREIPTSKQNITILIVYKPVGIRTIGSFSDQTLEMIVTAIWSRKKGNDKIVCKSMSKLDTGCAGLCVMMAEYCNAGENSNTRLYEQILGDINYHFTACVHGVVPPEWDDGVYIRINTRTRRWTNKRNDEEVAPDGHDKSSSTTDDEFILDISKKPSSKGDWIFVRCKDRFADSELNESVNLSTVIIKSSFDSGRLSNLLCFILRKAGFPVVNDRFCKREHYILPRVMRNILKTKLCIGCFRLELTYTDQCERKSTVVVTIDSPTRLLCSYWNDVLSKANEEL